MQKDIWAKNLDIKIKTMFTIHLRNLILHGRHGVYKEEQLIEAPFEVNIDCSLLPSNTVAELEHTINYEVVFNIAKKIFATQHQLLEVLAKDIATAIKQHYDIVWTVKITIYKLNPAIEGIKGQVGITYEG
jgi:7,8-dihydroneopterin aldolase/epimerase/oxygenase